MKKYPHNNNEEIGKDEVRIIFSRRSRKVGNVNTDIPRRFDLHYSDEIMFSKPEEVEEPAKESSANEEEMVNVEDCFEEESSGMPLTPVETVHSNFSDNYFEEPSEEKTTIFEEESFEFQGRYQSSLPKKKRIFGSKIPLSYVLIGGFAILAILIIIFATNLFSPSVEEDYPDTFDKLRSPNISASVHNEFSYSEQEAFQASMIPSNPYVDIQSTVSNGIPLTIYTPLSYNTIELKVGPEALNDSKAVLIAQAADVRADNGEILGSFVEKGELKGRGESNAGYFAVINGKPYLGVADSTPYLEEALEKGGYFFRQFPLIVGGQMLENKLKGKTYRKALAELNGQLVIISTEEKVEGEDFIKALADMGVKNAIRLIGSTTYGFARTKNGNLHEFGNREEKPFPKSSYIIWK